MQQDFYRVRTKNEHSRSHPEFIPAIFSTLILSGCATSTLSLNDAQQYKNLDIYGFIKNRFVDSEQNSFFDSVDKGIDSLTSTLSSTSKGSSQREAELKAEDSLDKQTTGLLSDGKTVIFESAFTEQNYRQMLRPKVEITHYCSVKGGKLKTVFVTKENFVANYINSVDTAFSKIMEQNLNALAKEGNPYKRGEEDYAVMVSGIHLYAIEHNKEYYNQAIRAYANAANSDAFGSFQCIDKPNGKLMWSVIIAPFSFTSGNPNNLLTANQLKILISPKKADI